MNAKTKSKTHATNNAKKKGKMHILQMLKCIPIYIYIYIYIYITDNVSYI